MAAKQRRVSARIEAARQPQNTASSQPEFDVSAYLASTESIETSYGEESRKFRRTAVYTHDDWVKHRSPNRFFRNLSSSFSQSGIYKNLGREVLATTVGVAPFLVTWNCIFGDYQDFALVFLILVLSRIQLFSFYLSLSPHLPLLVLSLVFC